MGVPTILWREFVFFRKSFWSTTFSNLVSPALYLIAFGWGIGSGVKVGEENYLTFIVPGIIALTTMTTSFEAVAFPLNIDKIYGKTLEEFITAPITPWEFVWGKVTGGAFRGLYSALLIILLAYVFSARISMNVYFLLIVVLNSFVFSTLGFVVGLAVMSYEDVGKFNNFVITPMAFLYGTFFPIEKLPYFFQKIILFLPLTHAVLGLRNPVPMLQFFIHLLVLGAYLLIFGIIGVSIYKKIE
ncbi:ABC-2 type transporter [Thermoanaerobacter kivui]|uniref:Transport permease protein n=1 Tax=Thermoanaerobacter kivui TaxID=2325 RepID=A0A097AR30_THEKI|nr:ABC transporter permease [Thermoanaerobacter kivui]AIS52281.1 ABC-2 type transporter [Thermoanaerobacter kivui]